MQLYDEAIATQKKISVPGPVSGLQTVEADHPSVLPAVLEATIVSEDTRQSSLDTRPQCPNFRPRRNKYRLDLRPAIWSLRNRPEEWEFHAGFIVHVPSKHVFYAHGTCTTNGFTDHKIGDLSDHHTRCSCTCANRAPLRDRIRFRFALLDWRHRKEYPDIEKRYHQFMNHFK
jgi:hypothetical protein